MPWGPSPCFAPLPGDPVLAFCDAGDDAGAPPPCAPARGVLAVPRCGSELGGLLEAFASTPALCPGLFAPGLQPAGKVLALAGAKAESGPPPWPSTPPPFWPATSAWFWPNCGLVGDLCHHFRTRRSMRNLSNLLGRRSSGHRRSKVEACLWSYAGLPACGSVRPQSADPPYELSPEHTRAVLDALAQLADYVSWICLAGSPRQSRRGSARRSPGPGSGSRPPYRWPPPKRCWKPTSIGTPLPVGGAVVVNRLTFAVPVGLGEAELQLGIPYSA